MDNFYSSYSGAIGAGGGGGGGVSSLNGQSGALTLLAGSGITITPGSGTLTIDATGGGSAITDLTGDVLATGPGSAAATVTALQGNAVINTVPTNGQVLTWFGTGHTWRPQTPAATGANVTLSNLTSPTDINQDLISATFGGGTLFSNFPGTPGQGDYTFSTGGTQSVATTFTPGSSVTVTGASFACESATLTLAGVVFAQVWSDSGGVPGTMLGQSDSITASTLDSPRNQVDFTFSTPVSVVSGTPYWIAVTGDATYIGNTDQIMWIGVIATTGLAFRNASNAWATPGAPTPAVIITSGGGSTNNLGMEGTPWNSLFAKSLNIDLAITPPGTDGNQIIDKTAGTVNFAAAANTLTVTNGYVTANSLVFCTILTNDATATIMNVVPSAGSFTINLGAAATAETSVGFLVINQ